MVNEWGYVRQQVAESLATLVDLHAWLTHAAPEAINEAVAAVPELQSLGPLPRVPDPAQTTLALGVQHLAHANDHVAALGALAAGSGLLAHSRHTLARASLESAGRATWLLDHEADWLTRISRCLALVGHDVDAAQGFIREQGEEPIEWPLEPRHMREAADALGVHLPKVPGKRRLAAQVVDGHRSGTANYSRLSGLTHGEIGHLDVEHAVATEPARWPATYALGWVDSASTCYVSLSAAMIRLAALVHPASAEDLWSELTRVGDHLEALEDDLGSPVSEEEEELLGEPRIDTSEQERTE